MTATNILMQPDAENSNNPMQIKAVLIQDKLCDISDLYDYLKDNPDIKINIAGCDAFLTPVMSLTGQKYIRTSNNNNTLDPLMSLPRLAQSMLNERL